jgi:tetratricopeptide (TPR) repeat protein
MDVDSIEVGVDFAEAIQQAVASCEVLLALVGPQWLTITDANGQRRLEDPDDTVRLEIEAALARNIRVIPVLVDNTLMPQRQQLPESLAPLSRRNALELSYNRYGYDLERLLEAVGRVLGQRSTPVATPPMPKPAEMPAAAGAKGAGLRGVVELVGQAKTACDRKRFQEALGHLDKALQLAPDDPFALLNRGVTYIDLGRNEEALVDLDHALQLAPTTPGSLSSEGACPDSQPSAALAFRTSRHRASTGRCEYGQLGPVTQDTLKGHRDHTMPRYVQLASGCAVKILDPAGDAVGSDSAAPELETAVFEDARGGWFSRIGLASLSPSVLPMRSWMLVWATSGP